MGRPKKISDEQMMAAAGVAIGRLGPGFTLADVGAEAGITAGTLVHRFGSKRGLLVAMMRAAVDSARVADPGTDSVREALLRRYAALDDPAAAANHLAQLGVDLADPELRAGLAELYAAIEDGVAVLVRRAVEAGELPGAPAVDVAARVLAATANGTAIAWSTAPVGSLRDRLTVDLDAILTAWTSKEDEA